MVETVRKKGTIFNRPSWDRKTEFGEKFEVGKYGEVKKTRARHSITAKNIAVVVEGVEEKAGLFIHRRSLELRIPQTSLHRIFHTDLSLGAQVQLTQKFQPTDHKQGRVFIDLVLEIIFRNESHFHLGGFVHKR